MLDGVSLTALLRTRGCRGPAGTAAKPPVSTASAHPAPEPVVLAQPWDADIKDALAAKRAAVDAKKNATDGPRSVLG